MKRAKTLVLLALLSLVFTAACGGCNGCGKEDVDTAAEERVSDLTALIPAEADAAVVVPKLRDLPATLDYAFRRIETFRPEVRAIETRLNQGFGVRLTDLDSWDDTGFDPDGSVIFAMMGNRPVLAAYVDDTNAFETHFIGRIRRVTDTPTPIETNTIGDRDFRVSGNRPGIDMAWFYDDSIVVLVMPPLDALDVFESGSATAVARTLAEIDEDSSLASAEAFQNFRKSLGNDYPLSVYINAESYLERPELLERTDLMGLDPLMRSFIEWSNANAESAGVGLDAGDQQVRLRFFAGGDDEVIAEARQAWTTEQDVDWQGFLTTNTVLATKTSMDLPSAYQTYVDSLPDEDRRALRRTLSQIGRNYEIDIEDDVIGALSGHSMIAFYGIAGDREKMVELFMAYDLGEGLRTLLAGAGLMINLHFADAAKKDHLLDVFTSMVGDFVEKRPLVYEGEPKAGFQVIEPVDLQTFPGRLYSTSNSLTLSTSAIGEGSGYEYLTNNRDDDMLADSDELVLGQQFATTDGMNGLYLNFHNLRRNLRNMPLVDAYASVLRPLHELLFAAGVDEYGFYLDAVVGFTDPLEDGDE